MDRGRTYARAKERSGLSDTCGRAIRTFRTEKEDEGLRGEGVLSSLTGRTFLGGGGTCPYG